MFQLTQPPSLITLAEAKDHLKIAYSEDDEVIQLCIDNAQAYVQAEADLWLGEQTWRYFLDAFPCGQTITIKKGPLKSITSVKYLDADEQQQTLSASKYVFARDLYRSRIVLRSAESWPEIACLPQAVEIDIVGGYKIGADTAAGETELPKDLRKAMFLLINHYFEYRELVYTGLQLREFPKHLTVERIIGHYRKESL